MTPNHHLFTCLYNGIDTGIDVTLSFSGTASAADYEIFVAGVKKTVSNNTLVVTIPVNQTSVEVKVKTIDDTIVERLYETLDIWIVSAKLQGNANVNYAFAKYEPEKESPFSPNYDPFYVAPPGSLLHFKIEDNDLLDMQKVVFQNVRDLQSDPDPTTGVSTPWTGANVSHWEKNKQLNKDPNAGYVPVAYSSQDEIWARAKWLGNVDPAVENALWAYFELTVGSNIHKSNPVHLTKGSDGSWVVDGESFKLPKKIATIYDGQQAMYIPNFTLTWKFYVGGDEFHRNAGVSNSCLYVTYDTPAAGAVLYHTVVHTGCVAANGITPATSGNVDQPIFDAIWNKIKDRNNYSVKIANGVVVNNELLMYYGRESNNPTAKEEMYLESVNGVIQTPPSQLPSKAREFAGNATCDTHTTKGLLAKADGTCSAWTNFMVNVLGAQGISATRMGIEANQIGSVVGGPYNAFKVKGNAGQGTANPKESIWWSHAVVGYDGKIYDPSYGKEYGVQSGALTQFMTQCVESVGTFTLAPAGGIQGYGKVYVAQSGPLNTSIADDYFEWTIW